MKSLWLSAIREKKLTVVHDWLLRHVLTYDNLAQALLIIAALLVAFLVGNRIKRKFSTPELPQKRFGQFLVAVLPLATPVLWLFLQLISLLIAVEAEWPHNLLTIVVHLLAAWIVIRTASLFFSNTAWIRLIALLAWTLAALNILDLLGPAVKLLDRFALTFGGLRISLLTVLEGFLILTLLLWGARLLSHLLEKRIRENSALSPSIQVLFIKLSKITLITAAILAGLRIVGLDLSGFT
ncbi:MAG: hypothetical protein Q8O45_00360, partial [Desulfurivibrionaceae bacterium]|nr:hypothetical protein [Desulfurivibrionaceae bacterium]